MTSASPGALRRAAWTQFRERPRPYWVWLGIEVGLWGLLEIVVIGVGGTPFSNVINLLLHIAYLVLAAGIEAGVLALALDHAAGRPLSWRRILTELPRGLTLLVAKVLYLLVVGVGLVLLVVPGIVLAARLSMFGFVVVERNLGPVASLRESFALTRNASSTTLGLLGFVLLINVLGAAFLGVGLVLTLPVSLLIAGNVYRQLRV